MVSELARTFVELKMKTHLSSIKFLLPALLIASTWSQSLSANDSQVADAAVQINAANDLVRDGKFDEAIDSYVQIQAAETDRSELNYNLAVAQFHKGELETAEQLFRTTASSADTRIAADSRYNLGNCLYGKALKMAEQDKPAVIEQLREAIGHYRSSLDLQTENVDARANIELAGELIRKLKEEQQQQEEQQQEEQQQEEQQQDEQQQDEQQSQSDQQQEESQKQDSGSDQQQDQPNEADSDESSSDEQESSDEQSESQQDQSGQGEEESAAEPQQSQGSEDQQNQDQTEQDSGDQTQESESAQSKQQNQTPADRPSGESQSETDVGEEQTDESEQAVPTGELTAAGEQDENGDPAGSVAMADPNLDGQMSKEEALKMLQAVRDRDMLRRLRQEQTERSRHVPVDKDW